MIFRAMALLIALLVSPCALADDIQVSNGQAVNVEAGRAYLLVRTSQQSCGFVCGTFNYVPIFIRILENEELNRAITLAQHDPENWKERVESNVVEPLPSKAYVVQGDQKLLLISVKPGTYVIGGLARTRGEDPGELTTSLCMGTVKFEAKAGVITNLGTILNARDDEPTSIPELSNYVAGKSLFDGMIPQAVAIEPGSPMDELPLSIRSLPLVAADYRAVARFPNYLGAPLMRLAPLPGILDYDKDGNVIDLKAGAPAGLEPARP
jgi:hypothetical protein